MQTWNFAVSHWLNNLCAAKWSNYLVDIVVVVFLIGYTVLCAKRGFIDGIFDFASTGVALIASVLFAKLVLTVTGGFFGLQGVMERGFTGAFSKISGFEALLSDEGLKQSLSEKNFAATIVNLAIRFFGKDRISADMTIAALLGSVTARLLSLLITSILLFIACKILLMLLKKILGALVEKIALLEAVDSALGAAAGLLQGLLIVCTVLAILSVIPVQAINNFFANSLFLGWLYDNNLLVLFIGLFI